MAEAVAAKGHEVTIFSPNRSARGSWKPGQGKEGTVTAGLKPDIEAGVRIERFAVRWPTQFGYAPDLAAALRNRIGDFDVVHLHALYLYPTLAAGRICFAAGIPYMVEPHGSLDPWHRRHHPLRKQIYSRLFEHSVLDRSSAIHDVTAEEMRLASAAGIRAPGLVIPHGVDVEQYTHLPAPGAFRARHHLASNRIVLFLGRITPKKGLDLLVQAFDLIHQVEPDARLVIAGPDDEGYGPTVRNDIASRHIEQFVTFAGMVEGQEKLELLADADVWVLPSYAENFGLAALEAMCSGLPTVLSDKVNIHKEFAQAGAILVVSCDAVSVSTAILRVLREPGLAATLRERGQALAATYTWNRTADLLIEAYTRMATGRAITTEAIS